mgnify:CR=1 FL=1
MEIKISQELNDIIKYAREEAMRTGSYGIGPDHLFLGIIRHADNNACKTLQGLGVETDDFKRYIDGHIFTNENIPYSELEKVTFTRYAQNVLSITIMEATRMKSDEAAPQHLLLALARTTESYGQAYLRARGIDYGRLLSYMENAGLLRSQQQDRQHEKQEAERPPEGEEVGPVRCGAWHRLILSGRAGHRPAGPARSGYRVCRLSRVCRHRRG